MSPAPQEIIPGTVIEFFEAREILCAVCLTAKNQRFTVLTEQNKEMSFGQSRVTHVTTQPLDVRLTRDALVKNLTLIAAKRRGLAEDIDLEELWDLLQEEQGGAYEPDELAEFVFSGTITDDHVAAMQRKLLQDRTYFQFKDGKFLPRTAEKIEQRRLENERQAEREAQLEKGSQWLAAVWNRKPKPPLPEYEEGLIEELKNFCLFGQDSPSLPFIKELFKRANIPPQQQSAFKLLVRLGVWDENENIYLHELSISTTFSKEAEERAAELANPKIKEKQAENRRDLRDLHTFTIDSAYTRDYDDALSLKVLDGGIFEVGIHIADASAFVPMGDLLDREAEERASSIYLPDARIAMLPGSLSEGICSLQAGKDRLAMSFLIRIDDEGAIQDGEILLSVIRVREQLTYENVNGRVEADESLGILHRLALKLKEKRIADGAIILPLPEIQVHVNGAGMIQISRYEKETPSQTMVSEWMIAANRFAASYLADRDIPGIFRSQGECKPETDFTQSEHPLFRIYRQRRLFARAELDTRPGLHCSLALPCYTTVTSPIRRYSDLIVQRQIKHALETGLPLYGEEELRQLILRMNETQSKISFVQRKWTRYWILRYLEQEDIHTLNALVLEASGRFARVLLPDFLIEARVPITDNTRVQPGEMVKMKIERLNPREDLLRAQFQEFSTAR